LADFLSLGVIGVGNTKSQPHRELVSGSSFPVGFENEIDGSLEIALDAIHAVGYGHSYPGVTKQGLAAVTRTRGNKDCFMILCGFTPMEAKLTLISVAKHERIMMRSQSMHVAQQWRKETLYTRVS